MTTECHIILMRVDVDVRLAAAVGGAARVLAEAAGVDEEAASQWQTKVVQATYEALAHPFGDAPRVDVKIVRLVDRIEVTFIHSLGVSRLIQETGQGAVR